MRYPVPIQRRSMMFLDIIPSSMERIKKIRIQSQSMIGKKLKKILRSN